MKKFLVGAAILGLLQGCAGAGGFKAYAPPADKPIQKIGVLTIKNPPYGIQDLGSPALAFGAIGGAIAGAGAVSKSDKFREAARDFDYENTMLQGLVENLKKGGYQVVEIPVEREKPNAFFDGIKGLGGEPVDAYLDISTWAVGYSNVNAFDNDFRPFLQVKTRLVLPGSGETIYSEHFMYGYHNPLISATDLEAPKEFFFDNFDALMGNQKQAVAGLDAGVKSISSEISSRLAK